MPRTGSTRASLLLGIVFAVLSSSALADATLDRAKRLLERQQARQAYELLLPLEAQRAGNPEYDYLLGIAALDSGEVERAIFALERVLAVQPDNALARAEIARAYYAAGERETARKEFEIVKRQRIPPRARETVDRYLSAIAAAETTRVQAYFEAGFGSDSNVNSATASSQIALPSLGGLIATLNPAATQDSDVFTNLSGGVNFTHKLNDTWSAVGSAAANGSSYRDATDFNRLTLDGSVGARWARNADAVTVGVLGQSFQLQSDRYRDAWGGVAQWQHSYDERRQITGYLQHARLHYPSQSVRDADRDIGGVAYAQAFAGSYSPVLYGSVYAGQEKERDSQFPWLGHKPAGVRLGGQATLGNGWTAFGSLAFEQRRYNGTDPTFLTTRTDDQYDAGIGVSYLMRPRVTLLGQVSHTFNDSNIQLYRFRRTVALISMRFNYY
jgi:tetratricopeptide (TPR) repeat protein